MVDNLTKDVLGIVPGLMGVSLLGYNLKQIPKINTKNGQYSAKKIFKLGATNLIGVGLIGATAKGINSL